MMIPRAPGVPAIPLAPAENENENGSEAAVQAHPGVQNASSLAAVRSAFLLFVALLVGGAATARLVASFFP
jgi:hypothetical protein